MLFTFLVSPLKTAFSTPYPLLLLTNPPTPTSWPWHSPTLGYRAFTGPRASPSIDDWLGHPLLHMQLEPWVPPCVFFGWWFSPRDSCEHPLLYMSGAGRASQETAISGSCQQARVGIHNSVWVWWLYMGWIPRWDSLWMAYPSVSVTPSTGFLFHLLRRIEVSTLWSVW